MSDSVTTKDRKSKKEKKEKVLAVSADSKEDASAETIVQTAEKSEKKKDKKDKKKKSKTEDTSEDAMIVDSANGVAVEATESTGHDEAEKTSERKKKRKQRDADESGAGAGEDGEKKKKKKKKQSEDAPEPESSSQAPTKTKKDKKQKRQAEEDETATASTSTSTPAPATSAKSTTGAQPSADEVNAFLTKHSAAIHVPEGTDTLVPYISFAQLEGVIADGLRKSAFGGFKEPSPIQACSWPYAFKGKDVVGVAETGSGKTLAFGIPALHWLNSSPAPKKGSSTVSVLVVAPTRELAIQTHDTLSALGKPFGIASCAVFGGVPKDPQVKLLKNVNKEKDGLVTRIIVGTPGRILDLMNDGVCDLSNVGYLVLDEADRMLDKGFENDIRNIISNCKPLEQRQTMMFSATWPEAVRRLAGTFQRRPVRVTIGSDDLTANSRVEQSVEVFDDPRSKDQRLLAVLRSLAHKKTTANGAAEARVLVFALYKKEATRVEQMLQRQGFAVGAIHGDMNQNARMDALERFKNGTTGLLVATDVAARGLDIPNVGAVVNYTFPLTIEDYIHRIGRTGRGGKSGKSITFFTGEGHERALAGEFAKVLRESGFDYEALKKFPMTIKKKEHSVYGAFFRDDVPAPKAPTKIVF